MYVYINALVSVLLEEIGHKIDSFLNIADSSGDEGAIFSALVLGESLSEETLARLYQENDWNTIVVDGQELAVEQDNIPGTPDDDFLEGTDFDDFIDGLEGNDEIYGYDGFDEIYGGDGDDTIYGGDPNNFNNVDGEDTINGGEGNDNLYGGFDNDTIFGEAGDDEIDGGDPNNFDGVDGDDYLDGGEGNDSIDGSSGNDTIYGGFDDDTIDGGEGNDYIDGGEGNDLLNGEGNDTLDGGEGNDTFQSFQGSENSIFLGGNGDDVFLIDLGSVAGGQGVDFLELSLRGTTNNLIVNYTNPDIDTTVGSVTFREIESMIFVSGNGNDTIDLSGANVNTYRLTDNIANPLVLYATVVYGSRGNDSIITGSGNDLLDGVEGGRLGSDLLDYGIGEIDSLTGGAGADLFQVSNFLSVGGPSLARVYYDDHNSATAGTNDYADILDFNPAQGDAIRLVGASTNYLLSVSGADTWIYFDKPGSEPDEAIARVRNQTGLSLSASYFSYQPIPNNPGQIKFSSSSYSVNEDGTPVNVITLVRLNGSTGAVSVTLTPSDGTATAPGDYNNAPIVVNFANGQFIQTVTIPIVNDTLVENNETVNLTLSNPTGGATLDNFDRTATLTIFDDEVIELSSLNGINGFTINGITINDRLGEAVSSAGDINGDGFDDFIIGAPGVDPSGINGAGRSYVVFGRSGGFGASFNLSTLNGTNGFAINGIIATDYSSISVSSAGDVNGDGFDDIIIGAPGASLNGSDSGQGYVVFGRSSGFSASLNLSSLNGTNGFALNGINALDYAGRLVSSAGDINGDGIDDIIIGAYGADPNGSFSGQSYVVFGRTSGFSASLNLSTLNGANGFTINGINAFDGLGSSVSNAGDVNGDGIDDIIIGASGADPNGSGSGQSYVVFGRTSGFGATLNLSTLDGTSGFAINGINANDQSGRSVSNAGDVNGDGIDDLLISASGADPNGNSSGQSYVVFGSGNGFGATLNLSTLNGTNGFAINGINADDGSGRSVSSAGDFNGDGIDDLLISAPNADSNGNNSGQSYVVFGRSGGFGASLNLSTLDSTSGLVINGINADDQLGGTNHSVSSAGDINNDGFDDIIIGARGADPNGIQTGQSYVVFGRATTSTLPSITLAVSPSSVLEDGTTNLIYTFTRTGSTASALTVNYTVGGTATNGTDYGNIVTNVTFAIGSATATVTVDPTIDTVIENNETVSLTLASSPNYTIGTPNAVIGIITNDDLPTVTFAVAPSSVTEDGTTNLVYTFTRSDITNDPLRVNYSIGGSATNGVDYNNLDTSIVFAIGSATATVTVNPTADTTVESDETVSLTLASGTGYTIGTAGAVTGTITNDDTSPTLPTIQLSVSPSSVLEDGTTNLVYTFTRTGNLTNSLTVNFNVGGTATLNSDYTQTGASSFNRTTGRVIFAANSTTATVVVDPTLDTFAEADETVALTLTSSANYNIGTPNTVTGTISNDDPLPTITLAISPNTVSEDGTSDLIYTLTRTGDLTQTSTVNFSFTGTATFNDDYTISGASNVTSSTGQVKFSVGQQTKLVRINPLADSLVEGDETVEVSLESGINYLVGTSEGITGTITNDDGDAGDNLLTGDTRNNILNGQEGNDTLIGGLGNDNLTGGTGLDRFVFNSPNDKRDTITDFVVVDDTIALSGTGFGAGLTLGTLAANRFVIGTAATTADHRLIYNNSNGRLFFDADGVGGTAATLLATLSAGLAMTNADFLVI